MARSSPSGVISSYTTLALSYHALAGVLAGAGNPDLSACHPVYVGVDGDPDVMKDLGLARRWNGRDAALARYAGAFIGSPVFSHLAFACLAAILLVWLLRRGGAADLAMAGLMAGALAFALNIPYSSRSPATTAIFTCSTFRRWRARSMRRAVSRSLTTGC